MRFTGKVALVTGAASGVGRAVAQRLSSEGAIVFGHDVDADGLAETAQLVGSTMTTRCGDLSDPSECRAMVEACVAVHGRIDVLGNVAGIARSDHTVDVTPELYRRIMAVNADAPFFACQAALPHLLAVGGNIVNIASVAGLMGQAYAAAYCASKGAVIQLTRSLAMEHIRAPLRVNAIAPAGILTKLTTEYQMPADVDLTLLAPSVGFREMSAPEDVATLFAFLASDDARSITGSVHAIDNGVTAG